MTYLPIPRRFLQTLRRSAEPAVSSILTKGRNAGAFGSSSYIGDSGTLVSFFTFIVPRRVHSISILAISAGGDAASGTIGGAGGGLAYVNNIPVRPGERLTVHGGGTGQLTGVYRSTSDGSVPPTRTWLIAVQGANTSTPGFPIIGTGYSGGVPLQDGGAGAAGYKGAGGNSDISGGTSPPVASGAAGGGGDDSSNAGGGGGVGLLGIGATGAGSSGGVFAGQGGSGGNAGTDGYTTVICVPPCPAIPCCPGGQITEYYGGNGGLYGGGAGQGTTQSGGFGRSGVRIVWPGNLRNWPDKRVGTP